jgi:DNA repair exonuclease SbcCD nuclease subunit
MNKQHGHSWTRRSFLWSVACGSGSVLLRPPCLQGSPRERPQLSFIVVSDTHLGYRDQASAARQWERTAREIARAPGDLVLHLGDVVDGGREAQYPIYVKTRRLIDKPVYEIPGNHDPQPLFAKHLRKQVDTVVDHHWLRFLLLNNAHIDSHHGFLSAGQLRWLNQQCHEAARRERFVLICMHVPAHTNRHPDRGWYVQPKDGQTRFYEVLKQHQQRLLGVFHGHFHNGIRGWEDHAPVQEIVFPSALYNRDRRLTEQKAPGYNLREFRPGFTRVTISGGVLKLEYQPVGDKVSVARDCKLTQLAAEGAKKANEDH